jgi:predicted NBD/HSP70 family sugar kinase
VRSHASRTDLLTRRSVPTLTPEQVERFTYHSLRARSTRRFDPRQALRKLRESREKCVIAIDVGGDKLISALYRTRDGILEQVTAPVVRQGDGGSGYVDVLKEMADRARRENFSVGISFAGLTNGARLVAAPNLPVLFADLRDRYNGDFANLFLSVEVANDAEAGIMAASLETMRCFPTTRHVIYVINGSGLGGAVLKDGEIFASEPGHIMIERKLNRFQQGKVCGMLDADYVCLEMVAASKAGIEDLWLQHQGEQRSGKEIADTYLSGDQLALDLYDNSALVTAHVVTGLAKAFDLPLDRTSVVGHGGIFQVPGYGERVRSILEKAFARSPSLLFTKDFSANACLDGAAIIAVTTGHEDVTLRRTPQS